MNIKLFGTLGVIASGGAPVQVTGAKTQGLVAYLALNLDMPPTRDRVMTLFWGDRSTEQARQSLRQAVAKLRRMLAEEPADTLISDDERVGFNPERVAVDVDLFHKLARSADPQDAQRALELMSGPLLDGVFGRSAEFEGWLALERSRAATVASALFERVAEHHLKAGELARALDTARRLIALDPLRDRSQMLLIQILAQSGERAAAIKQYNDYVATLRKELAIGAGPALQRLMHEIRAEGFTAVADAAEPAAPARHAAPGIEGGRPGVAVATFSASSPGPGQDGFVEAISQDIATNLARFRWLDVRACAETGGTRLTAERLREMHAAAGVQYVVHGTLRTAGEHLRLTTHLVEVTTGRYLWVERYERTCADVFAVQNELSETIAASVEAELQRLAGRASRDVPFEMLDAWGAYHRGLAIQYEFSAETNADAQRHFRRAIELDPNFAAAYARLSYAMVISAIYFDAGDVPALLDEALRLAKISTRLDPDDAVGRFALGRVYLARGEYDRSLGELRVAIDLNPGMAQAYCGLGDSLAYAGEVDRAMDCFNEAVRISPSDPYRWAFLSYGATALLFRGDFEEAVSWASRAESVPNAHFWATAIKASALGHLGRTEEAQRAVGELRGRHPGISCDYVRERLFYLRDSAQVDRYVSGLAKAGLA